MNRRLIFVVAALIVVIGSAVGIRHFMHAPGDMKNMSNEGTRKKELYQCSMHPQIVSDKPGNCPICGMRLEKVDDEVAPSAQSTQVKKEHKILYYRNPMRPDITSLKPAKDEMGMDYVPVYADEIEENMTVVDGHAPFTLSPERQQLIGVRTTKVMRRNMDIEIRTVGKVAYDPELYNALAEYREALTAREKIKESVVTDAHERAGALVQSSMLRLRLMGLSDEQIQEMAKEDTADSLNLLLPEKTAWVYAQVYEYEVDLLRPGQAVIVTAPSLPGRTYRGKVLAIDPVLDSTTRTVRVRAEISTPEKALRPEMFVNVKILAPAGQKLAIPENAVLNTGEHKIVFVKKGEGRFEPRSIQVGRESQGNYEVLSGLEESEEIVTAANFLIDSESRFRAAAAGAAPPAGASQGSTMSQRQ